MLEKIRKQLLELQEPDYQKFHKNLVPGVDNIIGIRVPILRNIAKEILKDDYISYIKAPKKYYEEIMIEGILIGTCKLDINEKLNLLDDFIPKINNWAINDSCSSSFKIKKDNEQIVWDYLKKYITSSKEFELRFIMTMWMDHYLIDDYIDDVVSNVKKINTDLYYAKMAKAWLISFIYLKYKEKGSKLLEDIKSDEWVYNKSIQKIIESNRITEEEKENLKKLKI